MSFGMFMPRAFWIAIFNRELASGLGPPTFTAMAISLPMRVNSLLNLALRAKIRCLRFSKMRPMRKVLEVWKGAIRRVGKNKRFNDNRSRRAACCAVPAARRSNPSSHGPALQGRHRTS